MTAPPVPFHAGPSYLKGICCARPGVTPDGKLQYTTMVMNIVVKKSSVLRGTVTPVLRCVGRETMLMAKQVERRVRGRNRERRADMTGEQYARAPGS